MPAEIQVAQLDVTNYSTVPTTLDDLSKRLGQPYDVVVVNAGVGNNGRKIGFSDAFEHHKACGRFLHIDNGESLRDTQL